MKWPAAFTPDRRAFLKFLAASPYVAALGGIRAYTQSVPEIARVIGDPKEALEVMDFEEAAHRKVPPGHWANMSSGVDDDLTMRLNHEAYRHIQLRPSRLHDATKVDMKVNLFGAIYNSPIFTCPASGEGGYHPDGELAVGRATKARGTLQMLSTMTSNGVEDVNAAHGQPVWYQLYAPNKWDAVQHLVKRVQDAGCPVILLTVDNTTGRNSEGFARKRPKSTETCEGCHGPNGPLQQNRKMYKGIDMTGLIGQDASMTWDFVDKLRKEVKVKLFIKGIDTREDARLALEHGLDGIQVSNHGGRATETLRPTIQALPEVVAEVGGRIPVFIDGGVRRGTDAFKALALGATAVGIGRPFLWGLGAFGQAGVDRVLEILQGELKLAMGNCGTQNIAAIKQSFVETPDWHAIF
jgi:isopentenyl diphosphate isomerase/L-lactate dehydrogenase-like FMN-dependent dehydrogenase